MCATAWAGDSAVRQDVSPSGRTCEGRAVNLGELVELLNKAADELPDGLDSTVLVHPCHGEDEAGVLTKEVGVATGDETRAWRLTAILEGHPHADDEDTVQRPPGTGVDAERDSPQATRRPAPASPSPSATPARASGSPTGKAAGRCFPALPRPSPRAASAIRRRTITAAGPAPPTVIAPTCPRRPVQHSPACGDRPRGRPSRRVGGGSRSTLVLRRQS